MSIDMFTHYLDKNMLFGPQFQNSDLYGWQYDSLFTNPPFFDIDVDILRSLAEDGIQTFEQPIGDRGDRSRWSYNGLASGLENHWETAATGYNPYPWDTISAISSDTSTPSASSPCEEHCPSIPNETFPMPGLDSPTLYRQSTEASTSGPPLEQVTNSVQGPCLETETHTGEILRHPVLQAVVSETPPTELSHTGAPHNTSNRSIDLPSTQLSPSSQPLGEGHYVGAIGSSSFQIPQKSATYLPLPSSRGESPFTSPSSLGKRELPEDQSSHSVNTTEFEVTLPTLHCATNATRAKRPTCLPLRSKRKESQELLAKLLAWGFVIADRITCSCGRKFGRPFDAKRHWLSVGKHKETHRNTDDFVGLRPTRCDICKEELSRSDSLARHRPNCGKRKKRRFLDELYLNDGTQ